VAEPTQVRHAVRVRLPRGPLCEGTICKVGNLVFRTGGRVRSVKFERRFIKLELTSPRDEAEAFAGAIATEVQRLHVEAHGFAMAVGRG
jgi:hypothetical protein